MLSGFNVLIVIVLLGVPVVCVYLVVRANQRTDIASNKLREYMLKGLLDETQNEINDATPDSVTDIANELYPKGSGRKR